MQLYFVFNNFSCIDLTMKACSSFVVIAILTTVVTVIYVPNAVFTVALTQPIEQLHNFCSSSSAEGLMEKGHVARTNDATSLEGRFISSGRYAILHPLTQLPEDVTKPIANHVSGLIMETHYEWMTCVLALEVCVLPLQISIVVLFHVSE